jgi:hypothetical protein
VSLYCYCTKDDGGWWLTGIKDIATQCTIKSKSYADAGHIIFIEYVGIDSNGVKQVYFTEGNVDAKVNYKVQILSLDKFCLQYFDRRVNPTKTSTAFQGYIQY